jgi:DNA invertase Pin-like site-specific DNA recombinase
MLRITVGHVRVSTQEQATNGVSLDAQESWIVAYCKAMGWRFSDVVCDSGESAKTLKSPGSPRFSTACARVVLSASSYSNSTD